LILAPMTVVALRIDTKRRIFPFTTMADPDELYTLRAQYWLGHYQLALEEAKSVARRPMSPNLKAEREELLARIHIALRQYDKATATDTPGT
jgi:coatomer protein complex subunit epsilon